MDCRRGYAECVAEGRKVSRSILSRRSCVGGPGFVFPDIASYAAEENGTKREAGRNSRLGCARAPAEAIFCHFHRLHVSDLHSALFLLREYEHVRDRIGLELYGGKNVPR